MKDALSHIVVHGTKVASVPFRDRKYKFPFNKDMAQNKKGLTRNVPFQRNEKDWNTSLEHLAGKSDSPFVTILTN